MNKGEAWLTLGILGVVGFLLFKTAGLLSGLFGPSNPLSTALGISSSKIVQPGQPLDSYLQYVQTLFGKTLSSWTLSADGKSYQYFYFTDGTYADSTGHLYSGSSSIGSDASTSGSLASDSVLGSLNQTAGDTSGNFFGF